MTQVRYQTITWLLLFCILCLITACQSSSSASCGDFICPIGTHCSPDGEQCVLEIQLEICNGKTDYARCSYFGNSDGVCLGEVCLSSGCGNGKKEHTEVCDDGNRLHGDGCSADCLSDESCGNGFVDTIVGESCDDNSSSCRSNCVQKWCGDGIQDSHTYEVCDNGEDNSNLPDATCRRNCQPQRCGDGIIDQQAHEECDDGNHNPGDGCSGTCLLEVCGNNIIDLKPHDVGYVASEACDDDAPGLSHDGCASACMAMEEPRWKVESGSEGNAAFFHNKKNFALAYDQNRGISILFGGTSNQTLTDETWAWNGARWNKLFPAFSPPARSSHAMANDVARGKIVLFGGNSDSEDLNDTWEWNGSNWKQLNPTIAPQARHGHTLVYDSARSKILLFGGEGEAKKFNDTWEWDGSNWTKLSSNTAPSPRSNHTMVFDPVAGKSLLFGGQDSAVLHDTWQWNGTDWAKLNLASFPSSRQSSQMFFDYKSRTVLLYGGKNATQFLADTWQWNGSIWTQVNTTTRSQQTMLYDLARNTLLLFFYDSFDGLFFSQWNGNQWTSLENGRTCKGGPLVYNTVRGTVCSLTCERKNKVWIPLLTVNNPSSRDGYAMAHNSKTGKTLLFGGYNAEGNRNDTWEYNGNDWIQKKPIRSPTARQGHAMAYHAASNRILLFGGESQIGKLNDTWQWDGNNWTQANPSESPPPRTNHSIAYDTQRQKTLLFGGNGNTGRLRDTWQWDGNNWTRHEPGLSPSSRSNHKMAYNQITGHIFLFGGVGGTSTGTALADTWQWDGSNWEKLRILQNTPQKREKHGMAYDAAHSMLIVDKGVINLSGIGELKYNTTWVFQYTAGITASCELGLDADMDGLIGCNDPDCWAYCTPSCSPFTQANWPNTCDTNRPHCGDGICNLNLENYRLCPADCPSTTKCGDIFCDPGETNSNCPGDCP